MLRANSVREESGEDYVHSICSGKGFYCNLEPLSMGGGCWEEFADLAYLVRVGR